jgi:hypothetical protein
MSSSQQHHHTTSMFARVVGPYLVIIAITAALRPVDMKTLLSQFEANSLWAWVVGAFILLLGLVTIALHPYWRGAAAIIVSVLGWLVALKGLMLARRPAPRSTIQQLPPIMRRRLRASPELADRLAGHRHRPKSAANHRL